MQLTLVIPIYLWQVLSSNFLSKLSPLTGQSFCLSFLQEAKHRHKKRKFNSKPSKKTHAYLAGFASKNRERMPWRNNDVTRLTHRTVTWRDVTKQPPRSIFAKPRLACNHMMHRCVKTTKKENTQATWKQNYEKFHLYSIHSYGTNLCVIKE